MDSAEQRYKLGIFVLSGIVILFALVMVFGSGTLFRDTFPAYTLFSESVQGLEEGTPVKFRGVVLGKVTNLSVATGKAYAIQADMELEARLAGFASSDEAIAFLEAEIRKGARCRLEYAGITGLKYIDIDYYDEGEPNESQTDPNRDPKEGTFIPSSPSLFAGLSTSLSDTLGKIASIDFDSIGKKLEDTLGAVNTLLGDTRVEGIISNLEVASGEFGEISKNLNAVATRERLQEIAEGLTATMKKAQEILAKIDQEVDTLELDKIGARLNTTLDRMSTLASNATKMLDEAKLADTSASARQAFDTADKNLRSFLAVQEELRLTLAALQDSLSAMEELVLLIEEDPSAILRGKKGKKDKND